MKPRDDRDPETDPTPADGPLANLVEDDLSRPLAEEIASELEEIDRDRARSGRDDYPHGTAEHDDDAEA